MRDYAELVKALRCFNVNYDSNKLTNDAADAIEELLAAVPHWISVEERLPEIGDAYIVAGKQRYPGEPWEYFTDVALSHGDYIDGFWDTFNDWNEGQETHITHWMPLPDPPKEVE